jgi:hypothetical protein
LLSFFLPLKHLALLTSFFQDFVFFFMPMYLLYLPLTHFSILPPSFPSLLLCHPLLPPPPPPSLSLSLSISLSLLLPPPLSLSLYSRHWDLTRYKSLSSSNLFYV